MPMTLYDILPEEISDEEASRLADIFMGLALAIDSHYNGQIRRCHKSIWSLQEEAQRQTQQKEGNNPEKDVTIQDDGIDF